MPRWIRRPRAPDYGPVIWEPNCRHLDQIRCAGSRRDERASDASRPRRGWGGRNASANIDSLWNQCHGTFCPHGSRSPCNSPARAALSAVVIRETMSVSRASCRAHRSESEAGSAISSQRRYVPESRSQTLAQHGRVSRHDWVMDSSSFSSRCMSRVTSDSGVGAACSTDGSLVVQTAGRT